MPRSHICPSCLSELGRIRAVPDEHYGLGVVVCPRCRLASVRTKHPDREFWRSYHRMRVTVGTVVGKALFTVLMGIFLWGMTQWATEVFADYRGRLDLIGPFGSVDVSTALGAWLIPLFALVIGALTRAIFGHWRAIWAGVFILVVGLFWLTAEYTFGALEIGLSKLARYHSQTVLPSHHDMIVLFKLYGLIAILVLLGLLPGMWLSAMIARSEHKRFRKLRKKLRKRRAYGQ
ncbi:MAG: hypothetical protein ACWA5W_01260 [Phycisphaerales bacterium]